VTRPLTVALAGNPNSGKTTIFNHLTGARQHVGNYPGVTVEKKEGTFEHQGTRVHVVDLPGTYSLTAYTEEEVVARNFLIEEKPQVVADVVDASNLERNLYLAVQLIELRVPLVLVLNMSDVAERRGFAIDHKRLGELLGARVVATVGHKGIGIDALRDAIVQVGSGQDVPKTVEVSYGREINEELDKLTPMVQAEERLAATYPPRWVAVKLLEDDPQVKDQVGELASEPGRILEAAAASRRHLRTVFGESPEIIIADRRYGFISGACQEAVVQTVEARHSMSDRIDAVVMHRVVGLPLFLVLMYLVFQFTFAVGEEPTNWIEALFGWLSEGVRALWPAGSSSALRDLVCDGVIAGVGGVLTFVPYIMLLFLAIAFLEDTGYMARAAFITDRLMHRIGLHGKSFIPMLLGFGCSVPAIMATRTLDTRRDRLTTMLVVPLMSCSARFVIYTVMVGAFFSDRVLVALGPLKLRLQPVMYFTIYLLGVAIAVVAAKVLRATILRGETTPLVMELPPYRLPTVRGLLIHMWERAWMFIRKAGTVILGVSIVLWVITTYPRKERLEGAYETRIEAAQRGFVQGVAGLAPLLGAPADAMKSLAEAELKEAEPNLGAAGPEGAARERLARFLEFRQDISKLEAQFAREVASAKAAPGSPAHAALWVRHKQRLDDLRRRDPRAYDAAERYLHKVAPAYRSAIEKVEHEKAAELLAYSLAGRIGRAIEPALRPLGFDWKIGTALIGAFAAKEVFVAQMGIVYAVGAGEANRAALRARLRHDYTPLQGFCIMLFCLVSMPCMATVITTRRESGAWRWALFQLGGLTALAYILTLIAYQLGLLVGLAT